MSNDETPQFHGSNPCRTASFSGLRVVMRTIVTMALSTLTALSAGGLAAQSTHPDLNGRVLTESGSPLNGASVFIYTAGPKVGVGTL
jgi:hypothetical protein